MGISTPINSNKIICHLHAQEPISQVSLDPIKLAINTNHPWRYSTIHPWFTTGHGIRGYHLLGCPKCPIAPHKSLVNMAWWKGNCRRTGDGSLGQQRTMEGNIRISCFQNLLPQPFYTIAFPALCLIINRSRTAPRGKSAGPDAVFPSLLETNFTFF